jgi:cytochrome d ubiquinol oxidase subunit I
VHGGSTLFTTLGFAGLYLVLGLLFVMLVLREIGHDARHPATAQLGGARQ